MKKKEPKKPEPLSAPVGLNVPAPKKQRGDPDIGKKRRAALRTEKIGAALNAML
jgi:hypothetical protein